MPGGNVQALELIVLLLLVFVAVFAALAQRLQTPYPIGLVIAGLLLGFIPGIPRVSLAPDIVFFVLLPPLLYAAAWTTSWRDFSYNLISIISLAFGLVAFTVVGVATVARAAFPGFDWRLGVVLGALVAPTGVYLTGADFHDGALTSESARKDLVALAETLLMLLRRLDPAVLGPPPLAAKFT